MDESDLKKGNACVVHPYNQDKIRSDYYCTRQHLRNTAAHCTAPSPTAQQLAVPQRRRQSSCVDKECKRRGHLLIHTPSVPNYKSFDFFNLKFDHSSYSKIYANITSFVVACFMNTPSILKYLTFWTRARSPKHNFDFLFILKYLSKSDICIFL